MARPARVGASGSRFRREKTTPVWFGSAMSFWMDWRTEVGFLPPVPLFAGGYAAGICPAAGKVSETIVPAPSSDVSETVPPSA